MQTINPYILNDLVKQIEPYAITDTFVIDEWLSHTGIHESPKISKPAKRYPAAN